MIMYRNSLITAIIFVTLITGCSIIKRFVYQPNINQGNYLSTNDVAKLHKGMTQQQVIYILGAPTLRDLFDQQVWHYIFRQQFGNKKIKQQTLTLSFDHNGILTDIKNINATLVP